jgi:branched-subunit amino acid ABC-type transport system permease component
MMMYKRVTLSLGTLFAYTIATAMNLSEGAEVLAGAAVSWQVALGGLAFVALRFLSICAVPIMLLSVCFERVVVALRQLRTEKRA